MDTNTTNPTITEVPKAKPITPTPTPASTTTVTPASTTMATTEELCGSENVLDTIHLKNLVDDLSKLYSTSVCTKIARDAKIASEKRLIEAIRANLDRYEE